MKIGAKHISFLPVRFLQLTLFVFFLTFFVGKDAFLAALPGLDATYSHCLDLEEQDLEEEESSTDDVRTDETNVAAPYKLNVNPYKFVSLSNDCVNITLSVFHREIPNPPPEC